MHAIKNPGAEPYHRFASAGYAGALRAHDWMETKVSLTRP